MEVYPPKKLLDQVRSGIRLKHCSYRTEQAHVGWIKRYIFVHNVRHPIGMGPPEFQALLTRPAVERSVAACPQNPCAACHACPEASRGERSEVRPLARCFLSATRCFTGISAPLTPCAGFTLARGN